MTSITTELAALLSTVNRPGDFFTAGTTELLAPMLEVDGVGPVALPLLPIQAKQLVAIAEPAPYGRGEETIIDTAVRRCWQIGPDRARVSGRHWVATLKAIVARVAEGLGVAEPVSAEFYKLLIYDRGSFFVSHRDTEKLPGMFATLLVVLPAPFKGGELVVRHKGREARLDLNANDPAEAAFAAFYADCVHEVLPLTDGYRLTLVYNLVRNGRGRLPKPPDYTRVQERLAALLQVWRTDISMSKDDRPKKLVYPLEHAYTPAGLGFASLKGADRAVSAVLAAAAAREQCDLHLALLTIEEEGAAEYSERHGSRRGRWDIAEEAFEAGEVFDRSVVLSEWRRLDGGGCVLGEIPVEEQELSPPDACDDLTPDEEHFHEATGNEGASFERTYRRAALVLWPSDRIFAVLSQAGLVVTLPYLDELVRRWAESGAGRESRLWREAHELAGHMLALWPKQPWYLRDKAPSEAARVLDLLGRLGDADTIERFLTQVTAAGCYYAGDNAAIIGALHHLKPAHAAALIERIVNGTGATAFGACADLLRRSAATWPKNRVERLTGAATRLVEALPGDRLRDTTLASFQDRPEVSHGFVVDLLIALDAIDAALAQRAITHLLAWPRTYGMDGVLIPALRQLATVGAARSGAIEQLRSVCVAHLRARVAEPLTPPVDWRRASTLRCRCAHCADLARYLADPDARTWVLKAAEADRSHVEETIRQGRCDLDVRTDRRGRPYSLVCTKNRASYERRAKQRRQDLDDLAQLAG